MPEVIARRELIAVTSLGERVPVTIELGKPVSPPGPNENWECHLSITPPLMHRPMNVRGYDALQALSLAISLANFHLREFIAHGGRLTYPDSDDEFTLDSAFPEVGRHPGQK